MGWKAGAANLQLGRAVKAGTIEKRGDRYHAAGAVPAAQAAA